MTQNDEPTPEVRTHQSFLSVTYVWVGSDYKGFYFFDQSEGYFRVVSSSDYIFESEQQCRNQLLTGNPWKNE